VTREEFVARLFDLGRRHGEIPTYGSDEWDHLVPDDPRRFASVVRAAECWRIDGNDAIRARLLDELADADLYTRWRVRMASHDVRGDTDWARVYDVAMARAEYRQRWEVSA
jgi:hypothetical protein